MEKGEALTLPQAIEIGQQFEMSKKQLSIVRDESEVTIHVVRRKKQHVSEPRITDEMPLPTKPAFDAIKKHDQNINKEIQDLITQMSVFVVT